MSHGHTHSQHHLHSEGTKNIRLALVLNLFFSAIELVGGLYTNSVAILSDALHDFGDAISLGVAWYLQKYAGKGRDRYYSYGYKRFSLLGAIFISIILTVGSVFVIKECVERLIAPQPSDAQGMFVLAILGIIINGAAVLRLKRGSGVNERAVMLHMMEDVLGWIAVLIVSSVMMFVDLPVLDPLLSIGISVWILINVYKNMRNTFHILLQQVPQDIDLENLEKEITTLDGVLSIHDIHLWTLDGEEHILTLHIVLAKEVTVEKETEIKGKVRHSCYDAHIHHATIEFERSGETCALMNH
ncbi:MAG: cation diffusion facilitator family transporter [Tannerellaceae bacterium]|jgi:cobalt-zinc-cadmium efflux system protein|nr:cation diffusion facilitator family transporter [Tannerellaceae bacterium]